MNSFVYARGDWPPRITLGTVVYNPTPAAADGDRASLTLDSWGRLRVSLDNASVTLNVEEINFGYVGIEDALGNKAVLNSDGSFKAQVTGSVAVTSSTLPVGAAQDTTIQSGNSTLASIHSDTTAIKGDSDTLVSGQTLSNSYLDDIWTLLNGGNLKVSWTLPQAVTQSGTWNVGITGALPAGTNSIGSVTANAGTNLNTSALALETGGNLAAIATAQGAQGTGASFNPPTGGSGILGYLSGIYKAITGALSVTFTNSTIAVTGTVTANAGTNLNTSALAVETGGNLATVANAQGAQGTGVSFNPPTGGSGVLGYLSGIYKAITGALSVTFTNSTIAVTGTVTANAGTNLNTSALAVESGGNLQTVATAQGAQGTGVSFNPPTGGSGVLGYLSGIYKAIIGTLTVGIAAGTNAIGTVLLGQTATSGDTSLTSGATAQNLFSGATPTNGFLIANPDATEDLWFSDSATAVINGQGSIVIPAGWMYETPPAYKPVGAVSVIATTTGHKITARKW